MQIFQIVTTIQNLLELMFLHTKGLDIPVYTFHRFLADFATNILRLVCLFIMYES